MFITSNQIPVFDQGLPTPAPNPSVYYQFSYTIPADAFKDPEGDPITITPTLIPNNFTITYDSTVILKYFISLKNKNY